MTSLSIGCFGKLPIHPDFIRYQATGTEIQALDQWFQEGIHFAKTRFGSAWSREFQEGGPWNFVFQTGEGKQFLVGSYRPSRDEGGRQYPFFLFLSVDRPSFPFPVYLSPLFFSSFLETSDELVQTGWTGLDMKGFISRIAETPFNLPDFGSIEKDYRDYLDQSTTGGFWSGLLGNFGNVGKVQIVQNLMEILEPLHQNPTAKFSYGLGFPNLSKGDPSRVYDIPLWCRLMEQIVRREIDPAAIFWSRGSQKAAPQSMIFLQKPSTRNLMFLLQPGREEDSLFKLTSENERDIERVMKKISPDGKALLDQDNLSLSTFLEKIGGLVDSHS